MQEAEHLISRRIHPQTIIAGYRKAARRALTDAARDNGNNKEKFEV
jgi:T-complex protein 1 subunit beta